MPTSTSPTGGVTPLVHAHRQKFSRIVELLEQADASPSRTAYGFSTTLVVPSFFFWNIS
ncbi:MAG: hypothetical protein MSC30_01505 [Gaiellaceae bacterium MAG52_C11]|nr:hypothetical protein [Candidatus Gaiellasilicea maunaloa]